MCRKLTILVLDHQSSVMTLFEQISFIPGEGAIFIVSAIFPLIQASADIRNHVILTLRKALYRKGTLNRQVAVSGILEMLRNLKIHSLSGLAMTSSQQHSSSTCTSTTSILTQVCQSCHRLRDLQLYKITIILYVLQVTLERGSQVTSTSGYNKSLCYDILGILKRCFTHECEVRLHLYNGMQN